MGLDVTYGAWSGSYGRFHGFRSALAKDALGLNIEMMQGFGGIDSWPKVTSEPLVSLLNHSDCDGEIPVNELGPLAKRLREVMPKLGGGYRHYAEQFAFGCEQALADNEPLEFM